MAKHLVEKFHKETEKHRIDLIIGIDDNPRHAVNAMFYVRMESIEKKTDNREKPREIWLKLEEMEKLSILMTMASRFWEEPLEKGSAYSQKRIAIFIRMWKRTRDFLFQK